MSVWDKEKRTCKKAIAVASAAAEPLPRLSGRDNKQKTTHARDPQQKRTAQPTYTKPTENMAYPYQGIADTSKTSA